MQDPLVPNKYFNLIHKNPQLLSETKLLMIGVGGIGCEILKVLCKMHIGPVHIIDMDTIELSNLNRQFLFKKEHKGMSKALVAKETILKINPHFNIEAHHKNIKQLPISFFRQFNFLIMALDNIEARNYVNKVGVRLGIPIIDAGTLGYKGNVSTIIPGQTRCYSCEPKSTQQKVFPVCTIRMRPQKPIHCIVWAKLLFQVLYGPQNDDNDLKDLTEMAKKQNFEEMMTKLFETDVLDIKNAKEQSDNKLSQIFAKSIKIISKEQIKEVLEGEPKILLSQYDKHEDTLSVHQNISVLQQAFTHLNSQKSRQNIIQFEKDDDFIIHFVSSAANLRMHCFNISQQSFNQIKNMAGNIVPAIASTNSIVSGLQITQMIKLIRKEQNKMKSYFIQNLNSKVLGLKTENRFETCQVCHPKAIPAILSVDLTKFTLHQLVKLVKQKAQFLEEFSINHGSKEFYNSDEPKQKLLEKSLFQLCDSYEADFVITNEDTMKKLCILWVIHEQNSQELALSNQEQFKQAVEEQENNQKEEQKKQEAAPDNDDSDIVMFDDQSPQIQIVEVKKAEDVSKDLKSTEQKQQEGRSAQKINGNQAANIEEQPKPTGVEVNGQEKDSVSNGEIRKKVKLNHE